MCNIRVLAQVAVTSLFLAANAAAQGTQEAAPAPESKVSVGGDLLFVVPVGTLGDATGPLLGPLVRGGYRVTLPVEITARAGYLFGLGKDQGGGATTRLSMIPVWVGARYFVLDPHAGPYAAGEIGLNLLQLHLDPDPGSIADEAKKLRARVGFDLGFGYVVSKTLPIDFRVQFTHFNLLGTETGDKAFLGLGLSAGYTFAL